MGTRLSRQNPDACRERFRQETWEGLRQSQVMVKMEMLFRGKVRFAFVKEFQMADVSRTNYVAFQVDDNFIVKDTRWGE